MLDGFFKDLGARFDRENDLSDITWALANNCREFLHAFMEFFGFEFEPDLPAEILREESFGEGSRPDFLVEHGTSVFLVENKIDDQHYHIEKYGKLRSIRKKPVVARGLITNHVIDTETRKRALEKNFKAVRTWDEFLRYLDQKLQANAFLEESEAFIRGYIEYVKEVCSIMEMGEIRFSDLKSLCYFNRLILKIIKTYSREGVEVSLHNSNYRYGECWSGQYFRLKRQGSKKTIVPFFGVYYEGEPEILVSFEKDWNEIVYEKYKSNKKKGILYYTWSDQSEVVFELNDNEYADFQKSSKEGQETILGHFLDEVIVEVSRNI